MKNIATIEHVLSKNFIRSSVQLSKTTTLEMAAVELQKQYNAIHQFRREVLAQDAFDVVITTDDVRRAIALSKGVTLPADEIGLVYNWLRTELPLMVHPEEDKAWARFVDYVKTKNLFGRFSHLDSKEVRRLFNAAYTAVGKSMTAMFYA